MSIAKAITVQEVHYLRQEEIWVNEVFEIGRRFLKKQKSREEIIRGSDERQFECVR